MSILCHPVSQGNRMAEGTNSFPSVVSVNSSLLWAAHVKQQVYLPDEDDD